MNGHLAREFNFGFVPRALATSAAVAPETAFLVVHPSVTCQRPPLQVRHFLTAGRSSRHALAPIEFHTYVPLRGLGCQSELLQSSPDVQNIEPFGVRPTAAGAPRDGKSQCCGVDLSSRVLDDSNRVKREAHSDSCVRGDERHGGWRRPGAREGSDECAGMFKRPQSKPPCLRSRRS